MDSDTREALEAAAKLVKTARRYFPKSIKNRDRFDLELTNAAILKALHDADAECSCDDSSCAVCRSLTVSP